MFAGGTIFIEPRCEILRKAPFIRRRRPGTYYAYGKSSGYASERNSILVKGTVRWFSNAFGYGFIQDTDGNEIFVHYSAIVNEGYKTLKEGQLVSYELGDGPKGPHATVVVPVSEEVSGAAFGAA